MMYRKLGLSGIEKGQGHTRPGWCECVGAAASREPRSGAVLVPQWHVTGQLLALSGTGAGSGTGCKGKIVVMWVG